MAMDLNLIEKFKVIFQYMFSSFLSIEMLVLSLLVFLILLINVKKDNHIVQVVAIGVYLGFVIGILISYSTYVKSCIDSFVKAILNYIYFPSTIAYFFIIIFVTFLMLYTLFSKKITKFKKIFNYLFFSILYFFFMSFVSLAAYDKVDLLDITKLYENNIILSIVQISNFILVIWIIITGFYWLYRYFHNKYD